MPTPDQAVETPREQPGKYIDEMAAALEHAAVGIAATDRDRECYRVTAECIDNLYDGSIVPSDVPPDFDREVAFAALKAESDDPRELAESVADTLRVMGEGYTAAEDDLSVVRRIFERYRDVYAVATGPIRSEQPHG